MQRYIYYSAFVYPPNADAFVACMHEFDVVKIVSRRDPLPVSQSRSLEADVLWDAYSFEIAVPQPLWPLVQTAMDELEYRRNPADPRVFREECVFSRQEVEAAELLVVRLNRSPVSSSGRSEGMQFELSKVPQVDDPAPWCWQRDGLLLRDIKVGRGRLPLHHTDIGEMLVHQSAVHCFSQWPARHIAIDPRSSSTEWTQLAATRLMPPHHGDTTGLVPCASTPDHSPPTCLHTMTQGYMPAYSKSLIIDVFGTIPPMSFTYELIGSWSKHCEIEQEYLPQPMLIVDQTTRRALSTFSRNQICYTPITLLD